MPDQHFCGSGSQQRMRNDHPAMRYQRRSPRHERNNGGADSPVNRPDAKRNRHLDPRVVRVMPTEIAMLAALIYSMLIVIIFGATFFFVYFWSDYDE